MNQNAIPSATPPVVPLAFDPKPLLDTAVVIQSTEDLARFLDGIADTDVIGVDTESAGFYRYRATVNLIQVSTRTRAAIIDPQAVSDLSPLREFPRRCACQWIFHGAGYDAGALFRYLGLEIANLFDTRLAAELAGLKELGLGSLAEAYLGFPLDKKLQRCDWSRRPLTPGMIKYGLLDAICLVPLRDLLRQRLADQGRLGWAEEEFAILAADARHGPADHADDPFAFVIKGASRMPPRQLAVLKEVWTLRDRIARAMDRAPFMVVANPALLEIARQMPRSLAGLAAISHMSAEFLRRHGKELQAAIKRGCEAEPVRLPAPGDDRRRDLPPTNWEAEMTHRLRELRDREAARLQVPPPLLASSHALFEVARHRPASLDELRAMGEFRNWQIGLLGEAFLDLLQKSGPPPASSGRRRGRRRSGRGSRPTG
ncbi:MAG: hypothetical protein GX442_05325 [Candidatus Riflebacteria bacterium]|nr:hypothetical protein [Candidatus Riflebacteria bacterium]